MYKRKNPCGAAKMAAPQGFLTLSGNPPAARASRDRPLPRIPPRHTASFDAFQRLSVAVSLLGNPPEDLAHHLRFLRADGKITHDLPFLVLSALIRKHISVWQTAACISVSCPLPVLTKVRMGLRNLLANALTKRISCDITNMSNHGLSHFNSSIKGDALCGSDAKVSCRNVLPDRYESGRSSRGRQVHQTTLEKRSERFYR